MKMREIFFINLRYSLSLRNYIISKKCSLFDYFFLLEKRNLCSIITAESISDNSVSIIRTESSSERNLLSSCRKLWRSCFFETELYKFIVGAHEENVWQSQKVCSFLIQFVCFLRSPYRCFSLLGWREVSSPLHTDKKEEKVILIGEIRWKLVRLNNTVVTNIANIAMKSRNGKCVEEVKELSSLVRLSCL